MYDRQNKRIDIYGLYDKITHPLISGLLLFIIFVVTLVLLLSDLSIYRCGILLKLKCILIKRGDNFALINTQILAIWAATNSFLVYYLGHIRDDFYGIKIIDSFKVKYSIKRCVGFIIYNIIFIGITFWSVLSKRYLVLSFYEILHFLNMLFVITMVLSEMSLDTVKKRIVNQTCQRMLEKKDDLIGAMCVILLEKESNEKYYLQNIKHVFELILENYDRLMTDAGTKESKISEQNKKIIFKFSSQFAQIIMDSKKEKNMICEIFQCLLIRLGLSDNVYLIVRKGIAYAIFDNILNPKRPDLKDIFGIQFNGRQEILYWALVCNMYLRYKYEQSYRKIVSFELLGFLDKKEVVEKDLFKIWLQFLREEYQHETESKDIDSRFEYFQHFIEEEILC